jgi:hypothetical protein
VATQPPTPLTKGASTWPPQPRQRALRVGKGVLASSSQPARHQATGQPNWTAVGDRRRHAAHRAAPTCERRVGGVDRPKLIIPTGKRIRTEPKPGQHLPGTGRARETPSIPRSHRAGTRRVRQPTQHRLLTLGTCITAGQTPKTLSTARKLRGRRRRRRIHPARPRHRHRRWREAHATSSSSPAANSLLASLPTLSGSPSQPKCRVAKSDR